MIKVIKIRAPDENIFLGGCFHYSHNPNWPVPLWKMRGFNSVEEHDTHQIKKWNEVCNSESIVFLLGDTIFGDPDSKKIMAFLRQINFGALYLLPGNHTSGWLVLYKKFLDLQYSGSVKNGEINYEVYPLECNIDSKNVIFLPNYVEIDVNRQPIILSHYAIKSWNKMARSSWMLHSHQHLADLDSDLQDTNNGKIADLGYETLLKYNGGAPISFDKLKKFMDKKPYKKEGHH